MFRSTSWKSANGLKVFAFALGTLALAASSQAAILYNPVVNVIGDGSGIVTSSTIGNTGYTDTLQVYDHSATTLTPLATQAFNSGASGTRLVQHGGGSQGQLGNTYGVLDAAATGHLYGGTTYVLAGGYDAQDGTAGVGTATAGLGGPAVNANRVVGQMTVSQDSLSNVSYPLSEASTLLEAPFPATASSSGSVDFRQITADNTATNFWSSGGTGFNAGSGGTGGWRYLGTNASPQSTMVSTSVTNTRTLVMRTNTVTGQQQMYGTSASGSTIGISTIANISNAPPTVLSTSSVMIATANLTGINAGFTSPYAISLFLDPSNAASNQGFNVIYLADDGQQNTNPAAGVQGGIQKWTYDGGTSTWVEQYIIKNPNDTANSIPGYNGLAAALDAKTGKVVLWATSNTIDFAGGFSNVTSRTELEEFSDTLSNTNPLNANNTAIILANSTTTGMANNIMRGVALAPIPSGDFNFDGILTSADIVPMEQAMTNPAAFEATNALSASDLAKLGDVDGNGSFNNGDLQALLTDLKNGVAASTGVPEPSTLVLGLLGTLSFAGVTIRRRKLAAAA
jgi:hypothetical protein